MFLVSFYSLSTFLGQNQLCLADSFVSGDLYWDTLSRGLGPVGNSDEMPAVTSGHRSNFPKFSIAR